MNFELEIIGKIFALDFPRNLGDKWLCDHPDDKESWPSVRDFDGLAWTEIDSNFWFGRESAMSYFSAPACMYFLPSIIASSYEDFEGIQLLATSVIREWAGSSPLLIERRNRRWKLFDFIHRGFLVSWVMHMRRCNLTMLDHESASKAIGFLLKF